MKKIFSIFLIILMLDGSYRSNAQVCEVADKICDVFCAECTAIAAGAAVGTVATGGGAAAALAAGSSASADACTRCSYCKAAVKAAQNPAVTPHHTPMIHWYTFDIGGAISRAVSVLIKTFLGDDTKIVAELVYDGDGGPCGGNGGTYTGDNGSADPEKLALNAVESSIADIPAEAYVYPDDVKVQDTDVAKLADLRIKQIVVENASLDESSQDKWAILYRAQQRSIQAMTDALVMKKAYKELSDIANKVSSGSYGNYSEAASTVGTRRLLLDALMALRKRVIAARIRARAETMEMDINAVSTAPMLKGDQTTTPPTDADKTKETVAPDNSKPDTKIEDYGLNDAGNNNPNKGE